MPHSKYFSSLTENLLYNMNITDLYVDTFQPKLKKSIVIHNLFKIAIADQQSNMCHG